MYKKPYLVRCVRPGCAKEAKYKIASRWSDGIVEELKTYALICADCLAWAYEESKKRNPGCKTMAGEILEVPGIFEMEPGKPSQKLKRRADLEF